MKQDTESTILIVLSVQVYDKSYDPHPRIRAPKEAEYPVSRTRYHKRRDMK